jgi:heterodisulfide reductase subunit A
MKKIGVFICHCGINIANTVDVERVAKELAEYPGVVHSETYTYMCSDPGQSLISKAIKEKDLDAVVVAACSPTLHELTFRKVSRATGLNPYQCEIANIREQCSWVHPEKQVATSKAVRIIKTAIEKARYNESLDPISVSLTKRALVIGGGIAGIQASLDIADSGYEVVLVERTPSIGGHMAQLSETFPTLDCSQCILTPRMVEVAQHPKIRLMTYSEIDDISGYAGNYKVQIRKKSTYVDWNKCNGCNDCTLACPVKVENEFDAQLSQRTAIYRPFPQAVPNKFTIDKRGTSPCKLACPAGVNAQGYVALITQKKFKEALALEREANPFPAVCGRVCTHPCETECKRGEFDQPIAIRSLKRFITDQETEVEAAELPTPKKETVAIVGSGPAGLTCGYYLGKEGYKTTVFEALPVVGGMLAAGIPDFRLPRDRLQQDIDYIKQYGMEIKTNKRLGEDFSIDDLFKKGYKAVLLALGAWRERRLGVEGEELDGMYYCVDFLRNVNLGEDVKVGKKVAVVGGGNAAIDAARTALRVGAEEVSIVYRRSRVEMPANAEEIAAAEEEGIRIEYLAAPTKILGKNGKVCGMECIRMELGPPDESGRRRPIPIEGSEFEIEADTIIPAISQSPELGPLKDDVKLEKTKWDTLVVDPVTLQTSLQGVFAVGDVVSGPATVIEAIAGGKEAAISIDRYIKGMDMKEGREIEREEVEEVIPPTEKEARQEESSLPVGERSKSFKEVDLGLTLEQAIEEANRCLNCAICCECGECEKVCEPDAIVRAMEDEIIEEDIGAIVVATGYELLPLEQLGEYGSGKLKNVVTGLQFERLLSASGPTTGEVRRPSDGKIPKEVVFVSCAGSREPELYKPYCSKICCMYTLKHAMLYKHRVPDGQPYVFYIDVRAGGKGYEEFYHRGVEEDGILYLRGKVSKIFEENGKAIVWGADTLTGKKVEVAADMVVLANAVIPSYGAKELANKLKMCIDEHDFLTEAHPKLRPVESLTLGVYLAGCAQAPRDIPETVAQASGAASKVVALFSEDELHHEPTIATVDEDVCSGCGVCIPVCPYDAREHDTEKKIAKVNEVLCEGCGSCIAACPSGASQLINFKDSQIFEMLQAAVGKR